MRLEIRHSSIKDLDKIQLIYQKAKIIQESKGAPSWSEFDDEYITKEIDGKRHFKLTDQSGIAAVFSLAYTDPVIWDSEPEKGAVYIHRVARDPLSPVRGVMNGIIDWVKTHATEMNRSHLRIDTWAENTGLEKYYRVLGFDHVGYKKLPDKSDLPGHYHDIEVSLFEMKLNI